MNSGQKKPEECQLGQEGGYSLEPRPPERPPGVALARLPDCDADRQVLARFVDSWRALLYHTSDMRLEPHRRLLEQHSAKNVALAECAIFDQTLAAAAIADALLEPSLPTQEVNATGELDWQ